MHIVLTFAARTHCFLFSHCGETDYERIEYQTVDSFSSAFKKKWMWVDLMMLMKMPQGRIFHSKTKLRQTLWVFWMCKWIKLLNSYRLKLNCMIVLSLGVRSGEIFKDNGWKCPLWNWAQSTISWQLWLRQRRRRWNWWRWRWWWWWLRLRFWVDGLPEKCTANQQCRWQFNCACQCPSGEQ